jgi:hypothetical protein
MASDLSLQELLIVVAADTFSPALINHEFLRFSGVLPEDWELSTQPIYSPEMVQLSFNTGVVLTVQPTRIILAESLATNALGDLKIPQIAQKLIQALPNLQYQAIGFNPTGHYEPESGETSSFFHETLMNQGPWFNVAEGRPKMTLNFSYQLERCPLNLTVTEAGLRTEAETIQSVVVFSGNFNYLVGGTTAPERQTLILENLQHWQADVQHYEEIINQHFLSAVSANVIAEPALLPAFT